MCNPVASLQQVAKLACIMLRTPHRIITTYVETIIYKFNPGESNLRPLDYEPDVVTTRLCTHATGYSTRNQLTFLEPNCATKRYQDSPLPYLTKLLNNYFKENS